MAGRQLSDALDVLARFAEQGVAAQEVAETGDVARLAQLHAQQLQLNEQGQQLRAVRRAALAAILRIGGSFNLYGSEGPARRACHRQSQQRGREELPLDDQGKWPHDLWNLYVAMEDVSPAPAMAAIPDGSVGLGEERRQRRDAVKRGHAQIEEARMRAVCRNPKGSVWAIIQKSRCQRLWDDASRRELFRKAEEIAEAVVSSSSGDDRDAAPQQGSWVDGGPGPSGSGPLDEPLRAPAGGRRRQIVRDLDSDVMEVDTDGGSGDADAGEGSGGIACAPGSSSLHIPVGRGKGDDLGGKRDARLADRGKAPKRRRRKRHQDRHTAGQSP